MTKTDAERRYLAGYEAARSLCLGNGSSEAALSWAEQHQGADAAYLAGYEWAIYDYDDANGLPRRMPGAS